MSISIFPLPWFEESQGCLGTIFWLVLHHSILHSAHLQDMDKADTLARTYACYYVFLVYKEIFYV